MNRLGLSAESFSSVYDEIINLKHIHLIGFMTHFAKADNKEDPMTLRQYDTFIKIVGDRQGEHSICNSAGIVHWPNCHGDWVRPGLILMGASPFQDCTGQDLGLKPVMNLESQLIAIQWVKAGESVGYAGTWMNPEQDRLVGVVAIGYGDGYPWHAKNGTPVSIHNQIVPLVGRVSMDMITVDLTSLFNKNIPVQIGDRVTLWGENVPIETVAEYAGTVPWELFCRLTERVTMVTV
jgi:alanine racemase